MFEPYGHAHVIAVAFVVAACIGVWLALADAEHRSIAKRAAPVLALVIAAHELANVALHVGFGDPWATSLPLNPCRLNMWICAFALWRPSYLAYEVAYFWAIVGSPVALLAPDLQSAFPHPLFVTFFLGHGLVIVAVLFATRAFGFRPRPTSIAIALGAFLCFAGFAACVNAWLGTNYLYLNELPGDSRLRDWLPSWPFYLIVALAIGALACVVAYLPFARRGTAHAPL